MKFTTSAAAQVVKDKIHGRLYGGQLVQVRAAAQPHSRECMCQARRPLAQGKQQALHARACSLQVYFISEEAFAKA